MTTKEKIKIIQNSKCYLGKEERYYSMLESFGDLKTNYYDYMITSPIDPERELERLPTANYVLCTALFTMMLREDRFSEGAFQRRYKAGQVDAVLRRMIETLENE